MTWPTRIYLWMSVHCALTRKVMTLTLTINDDEEHKAFPMSLHILQCTDMQPFMDRYTWDFWLFFVLNPFKFERKSMYDNLFLMMGWKWSCIDIQLWRTDIHHLSKRCQNHKGVNRHMHRLVCLHAQFDFVLWTGMHQACTVVHHV